MPTHQWRGTRCPRRPGTTDLTEFREVAPMQASRVVGLVALLCVVASGARAQNRTLYPLPTPAVPDALGVNIHFTNPMPGEMEQLASAGFRWIRMDFAWAGIERQPGQYNF